MRITYVWDGDYPWDIRADKTCTSLVENGHEVHIACRNLARKPVLDEYRGSTIHRMPPLPEWSGRANSALTFPAFFSPFWIRHINRVVAKTRSELVIARDLPLAPTAIWAARRAGVPVVLDMAECYPEMLRCAREFGGPSFKNVFLRNPRMADGVERYVVRRMDQIWVMVEESKQRLERMGVPSDRLRIISNTPVAERFPTRRADPEESKGPLKLVYVGLLNPSRGLDSIIRGVARMKELGREVHLTVLGSGKAKPGFERLTSELGVDDRVHFLGWVDNDRVPQLLAEADVGVVPHHKCSHWDNTIPNKLFDYMAAGIPVLVSNVVPMERVVLETRCGVVYSDFDVDSLVEALTSLEDPQRRREFAANGMKAVDDLYNWSRDERILLDSVAGLANA